MHPPKRKYLNLRKLISCVLLKPRHLQGQDRHSLIPSSIINTVVLPFGLSVRVSGKLINVAKDRTFYFSIAPCGRKKEIREEKRREGRKRCIHLNLQNQYIQINSFICQVLIEISLCIRHCSRYMGCEMNKTDKNLCFRELAF